MSCPGRGCDGIERQHAGWCSEFNVYGPDYLGIEAWATKMRARKGKDPAVDAFIEKRIAEETARDAAYERQRK